MTIHLGNATTEFDFGSGYAVPSPEVPDCNTDTSLWIRARGEDGRCYAICTADPSQSFLVDSSECGSGVRTTTAGTPRATVSSDQIIKGVPNWVLAATGIILFVAINN